MSAGGIDDALKKYKTLEAETQELMARRQLALQQANENGMVQQVRGGRRGRGEKMRRGGLSVGQDASFCFGEVAAHGTGVVKGRGRRSGLKGNGWRLSRVKQVLLRSRRSKVACRSRYVLGEGKEKGVAIGALFGRPTRTGKEASLAA